MNKPLWEPTELKKKNSILADFAKFIDFKSEYNFKDLWKCNITDRTRETIWKYLQLMLFCVIKSVDDGNTFGDTAKLFEAINSNDLHEKLEETLNLSLIHI